MSWLTFNVLSGIIIFLAALFLKFCLFKTREGTLTKVNDNWSWQLKRPKYPIWEVILVMIVCCIPVVNWILFGCQLVWILSSISDKDYVFSIINIDGIYNNEESLNEFKEQWVQTHKLKYKLYKNIKSVFTFSIT
jgi:hypothetical protein